MTTIKYLVLAAAAAVALSACGAPAGNAPASNSNANAANANTAKPTAAAPTADTFMPQEKQAHEAYIKGDGKFFDGFLSDKFAMVAGGHRMDKAAVVKNIGTNKCEIKDGWKLEDPQLAMVDADTYVISYKENMEGSCTSDAGPEKMDKPMRSVSVWIRNGDKWSPVFHGENPIVDPKAPPPPPTKAEPKKPEPKKEAAKSDDKATANSNSAAPAAPAVAKSANTDALVAVEKSGWEAWKNKDAKKLDEVVAKNLAIAGGDGAWMSNKADIIKYWVEMPCKDIKTVDVKDGFGTALSATVEMLTFVGSADGTCGGQKNGNQDSMSIYIKEGDSWKLAFGFSGANM